MRLTDKEAIETVKEILKNCTPNAKKAIQALMEGTSTPKPPAPRSMKSENLVMSEQPVIRTISKNIDVVVNPFADGVVMGVDTSDDDWLKNWIKT